MKFQHIATRAVILFVLTTLAACSGGGGSQRAAIDPSKVPPGAHIGKNAEGQEAIIYDITAADKKALESKTPLKAGHADLLVNGLGCPQCSSNVDTQLTRLPGVSRAVVDLSTGTVAITMSGANRPSPHQLREAVADAGFTLVRVRETK